MLAPLTIAIVAPLVEPLGEVPSRGNHCLLADLARGLAARGHEVVVHAAAGSHVPGVTVRTVDVDRSVHRRFALLRANTPAESRAMRDAFERLFERVALQRPDVVSQHAFDKEAIEGCARWPALHTLHLPPIRDDVVGAVRESAQRVCAVSRSCAAQWSAAARREVVAMPNGVPIDDFEAVAATAVALIAGRISREKGVATAIRVAHAAGLTPLVVGDVYDRAYFDDEVKPLLARATWLGAIPRRALWRSMARAAVTLMAIEWDEPFGLVAAEAQLCGCPVAGFRRGALAEIVEEGITGYLVPPGDADALATAARLASMLDRSEIRRRARNRFSMQACVERYERALSATASATV